MYNAFALMTEDAIGCQDSLHGTGGEPLCFSRRNVDLAEAEATDSNLRSLFSDEQDTKVSQLLEVILGDSVSEVQGRRSRHDMTR